LIGINAFHPRLAARVWSGVSLTSEDARMRCPRPRHSTSAFIAATLADAVAAGISSNGWT
jgi:hypothetical protein